MARILVVDDEEDLEILINQKFRKKIKNNEYQFFFAENGVEALSLINSVENIDMVLSDINMPKMDGLTLLGHLKEDVPLIKSVIVSAYGDMDNIRMAMNRGAFDFITKPIDFSDLTITIKKTLEYVEELKSRLLAIKENDILKMYVDESALQFMKKNETLGSESNELIEATVAFIDICGFTKISENASPDDLINLLNNYFDVMVSDIIANGGYIDKFIGDAVMAVFKEGDHVNNAVKACLSIRDKIRKLPSDISAIDFQAEVSIGLNTGEMIFGNMGSKSLKRLDFTVLGDVVNTAQRIQSFALPNQVLVGQEVAAQVDSHYELIDLGEQQLKNKGRLISIVEIVG